MKQLYTLLLMLPTMLFAQTDIDFQSISSGLPGPNWTWTADQTDTSFDAVDNPSATGINTSTFVGELTAAAGSVAYALAFSDGIGSFTFDANNTTVKIMVYKSRISPIEIKFEDATNSATSVARTASNTVINAWEEITFDFYSAIGNTTYGKIVIIPDNSERTVANITYFDNITFTDGVAPIGPSVAAPTPPARNADDVVSFYSDAYATAPMGEYFPSWQVGTVSDNPIDGNNSWKMDGLGFAALANYDGVDLSAMEKMYIDYYTTQDVVGAKLFVKLVDTNNSHELLLDLGDVTADSWQTVEIDLSAQNTANVDLSTLTQFLIDPSTDGDTFFIDNWYFAKGSPTTPSTAPTTAPAAPTLDAADVISFYSDSYTNISLGEYFPDWSDATVTDNPIDGNNIWKMEAMNFASVTQYAGVDLSGVNKMYIDYWTTQDTAGSKLFVKLVDTNAPQEELILDLGDVTAGSWQTVEVDLTAQNTANIDLSTVTQFLIDPSTDGGTFFFDNWYFANVSTGPAPTEPTTSPAAPTLDAADVISFYSDSYTNISLGEYFPDWSDATVTDNPIDGNNIWKMEAMNFASVTQYAGVDLSGVNKMYIDYWTTQDTAGSKLFVKLVDTNAPQEELILDLGDVTAGSWQTVEVDLTAQNTANIDLSTVTQFLIDPSTDGGTFFFDNWYFANVSGPGPSAAAPTPPARNAADVISLYSNAYTNVASNFDAGWCGANSVAEISVAGNDIMAWAGNDCQGIVLNTGVDASAFTNYNVDIYIEDGTDLTGKVFNLKFVGTPTSVFKEINHDLNALQPNIGEWVSLTGTVDLSTMSGFKEFAVTTNLANSVWYDNLYVYKGTPLSLEEIDGFNFVAYPNPVENILNVSAGNVVESVTIFDLTGREVMRTTPNATAFSLDVSSLNKGMFLVKVKAGKQELTTKLVK